MVSYYLTIKILILGEASVGKNSFIKLYCYNLLNPSERLTIGVDFHIKTIKLNNKLLKLQLWDVGGEERFRYLLPTYCLGANAAVLLYDVTRSQTLDNIGEWVTIVREKSGDVPIMLVGILPDDEYIREISTEEGVKISKSRKLSGYIECDLKTGKNIKEVFENLTRLILADLDNRPPRKKDENLSKSNKHHLKKTKKWDSKSVFKSGSKISSPKSTSQLGHKSRTSGSAGANIDPQLKGEVQSFLEWVKDNEGFSLYIDYYLQQNNTPFISELSKIYAELRQIFSEPPNLPLHPPPPIQLELHREQVMKFMSIIERYWPLKTSKIISAALIKSKNSILYSTDNWEISNDLLRIMLSWDSLKPPAPVIFGVKYSIILRSPKMFIVNSSKNKRQFLIAKEGDFALILHVKPNDEFAYPYIFTHPRPPDDFEAASQVQLRTPLKEKDSESEVNCQYCGMKLTREEQSTHSCEKKPEE